MAGKKTPTNAAMKDKENLTALVYDLRWNGHAPTYHKMICEELLRQGWNVVSASPMPQDVAQYFETKDTYGRLTIKDENLNVPPKTVNAAAQATVSTPPTKHNISLKGKIVNILSHIKYFEEYFQVIERWKGLGNLINTKMPGAKPVVFLPYLGVKWLHPLLSAKFIEKRFGYKWAGVYITIEMNRKVQFLNRLKPLHLFKIFKAKNCLGLYILEENVLGTIKKMASNNVWLFPDITNTETDALYTDDTLIELQHRCEGKKIILLAGILAERKNVYLFFEAARIAREKNLPWLFVIGGYTNRYYWESEENYQKFLNLAETNKENVIIKADGIQDGKAFNAYVTRTDIMFAAYLDFWNSSNILTKAAYFKKPVIVSKGYLMAERVEKYALGECVDQNSAIEVVNAINALLNSYTNSVPKYNEYYQLHTQQQIAEALKLLK